ncbi:GDP-mannose 4,6-dehydratase, partial [Pseudomonas aeruginosa]|uniref:GDP-mannose 4,6-dehydratase n=1 Tax=Pseudomonas aeruginosa TaxID=287 RepID=UPI0031B7BE26
MKKVLVTGADGFIGSHLTELLVGEGYEVKALSQYNSFNYWGCLEDVACLGRKYEKSFGYWGGWVYWFTSHGA